MTMGSADAIAESDSALPDAQPLPSRAECDADHPPIVMVHGFLASSDTWGATHSVFANDFCANRFHPSIGIPRPNADHVASLDVFIDEVLEEHGADAVDLMGHSAGGGLESVILSNPSEQRRSGVTRISGVFQRRRRSRRESRADLECVVAR